MKFVFRVIIIIFSIIIVPVYAQRGCCSHHGGVSSSCSNGRQVCNDGSISPSCTCSGGANTSGNNYSNNNYVYTLPKIYGCTDSNSINYNPSANTNDGSCIAKVLGCTNQDALNYNSNANTDDGSCIAKVFGCMKSNAKNYNSSANVEDGSCLFVKTKTIYRKIKYKTEYEYKLFRKKGSIIQKGKKGKKKIIKEITVNEKDEVIDSKIVKTEIVSKPVNKVVVTKKIK